MTKVVALGCILASAGLQGVAVAEPATAPAPSSASTCTPSLTGTLGWAYMQSMINYTVGPIARGFVQTDKPATFKQKTGPFSFPVDTAATKVTDKTHATIKLAGGFSLKGHYDKELYGGYGMDQHVSNIVLKVAGQSGQIIADYTTQEMDLGTMQIKGVVTKTQQVIGTFTLDKMPDFTAKTVSLVGSAKLAKAGEILTADYFHAGDPLADLNLTLSSSDSCQGGDSSTATTDGDQADKTGSDQQATDDNTASTGPSIGAAPAGCRIVPIGSFDWAWKRSITNYVKGGDGNILFDDGTAFTPDDNYFHFRVDPRRSVIVDGTHAMLSGDGGFRYVKYWQDSYYLMDTHYVNPRIVIDGDKGAVFADIVAPNADNGTDEFRHVRLSDLTFDKKVDLTKETTAKGVAKLTAYGSRVLQGFYQPGTVIAPVSFSVTPGIRCGSGTVTPLAVDAPLEKVPPTTGGFKNPPSPDELKKNPPSYPDVPQTDDRVPTFDATYGEKTSNGVPPNFGATASGEKFYPNNTLGLKWDLVKGLPAQTKVTATKGARNHDGVITFPHLAVGVRDEGNALVQYGGAVRFQRDCTGDKCDVDVTVSRPRVEFSPYSKTGNLFVTVTDNNNPSSKKAWPIGSFDGKSGSWKITDNHIVTWKDLSMTAVSATKKAGVLDNVFGGDFMSRPITLSYANNDVLLQAVPATGFGSEDDSIVPVTVGDATAETPFVVPGKPNTLPIMPRVTITPASTAPTTSPTTAPTTSSPAPSETPESTPPNVDGTSSPVVTTTPSETPKPAPAPEPADKDNDSWSLLKVVTWVLSAIVAVLMTVGKMLHLPMFRI